MYKFQLSHTEVNGALLEKTIISHMGLKHTVTIKFSYYSTWFHDNYDYKQESTEEHNLAQEEKSKQKWECTL